MRNANGRLEVTFAIDSIIQILNVGSDRERQSLFDTRKGEKRNSTESEYILIDLLNLHQLDTN